jgi:hypothetical protein
MRTDKRLEGAFKKLTIQQGQSPWLALVSISCESDVEISLCFAQLSRVSQRLILESLKCDKQPMPAPTEGKPQE